MQKGGKDVEGKKFRIDFTLFLEILAVMVTS